LDVRPLREEFFGTLDIVNARQTSDTGVHGEAVARIC
jgi:hypothetical protein